MFAKSTEKRNFTVGQKYGGGEWSGINRMVFVWNSGDGGLVSFLKIMGNERRNTKAISLRSSFQDNSKDRSQPILSTNDEHFSFWWIWQTFVR